MSLRTVKSRIDIILEAKDDALNEQMGATAGVIAIAGISFLAVTGTLVNEFLAQYSVMKTQELPDGSGDLYRVQMASANYNLMRVAVLTQAGQSGATNARATPDNMGADQGERFFGHDMDTNVLVKNFFYEDTDGKLYPVVLAPSWFAMLKDEKLVMLPSGTLRFIAK